MRNHGRKLRRRMCLKMRRCRIHLHHSLLS
jgi:hypothetical protein